MQRRQFLKGTAIGVAAASTSTLSSKAFAVGRKGARWRLAMAIPKTLPVWGEQVIQFADAVERMSGGDLKIKVYGAGEITGALQVFDAVKSGRIQMGHSAAYYWQGKIPASVFFTCIPFGMNANGMRAWLAYGGGMDLWRELYAPHGVVPFQAGNTGLQLGGWFRKPIDTPADYKGLKMRIPGLGSKVIAQLGAQPVLVPGGDIFTSLSTGVIDATEWVGPYHDYILGFHKATKYLYYPGWHEPGPVLELLINQKAWDGLHGDLQQVVRTAAGELDRNLYAQWLAKDSEYLEKIKTETKIEIREFPRDVLKGLRKASAQVLDELIDKNRQAQPLVQRISDSYHAFERIYTAQNQITEASYTKSLYETR